VSNRKKHWKGRAHAASARAAFELALFGNDRRDEKPFDPRRDHKTRQLCEQVRRALSLALAGECGDEILRDVYVESVEPMGSASQLLVHVGIPANVALPSWDVLARLNNRSPKLRTVVAQSICRKRAPVLSFIVVPAGRQTPHGGKI
jgi:ribosome-binding factor A